MPPMPHKSAFEPKDPRIINLYEDDDDEDELDDWSLSTTSDATPRPRKKKTGTQALVEFLNTTSPEEFEKKTTTTTPTKRSSNLFFRRRNKNKPPTAPSSTSSTPTPSSASYLSSSSATTTTLSTSRPDVIPPTAPNTVHRKNYIEIIPNHILGNPILSNAGSSTTSLTRVASRTPSLASRHSTIRRSIISNSDVQQQNQSPVLPNNRSMPTTKQRESSLYSDSIRHSMSTKSHSLRGRPLMRHDTDATFGTKSTATSAAMIAASGGSGFQRRTSEHTFGGLMEQSSVTGGLSNAVSVAGSLSAATGTAVADALLAPNQQQLEERDKKATETLVNHFTSQEDLETVEAALLQRLERFRLSKMDKPSDVVAAGLATEHVRALQVSTQEYEAFDPPSSPIDHHPHQKIKKKKIRHMQVQTMPLESETSSSSTTRTTGTSTLSSLSARSSTASTATNNNSTTSSTDIISSPTSPTSPNTTTLNSDDPMIIQLQQQLAEEQKQRRRLEAALEETCDHFEVLSGLAYEKLRELWEERTRWENACIELRDRLLEVNQGPSSMEDLNEFASSDYVVEEEKENISK